MGARFPIPGTYEKENLDIKLGLVFRGIPTRSQTTRATRLNGDADERGMK